MLVSSLSSATVLIAMFGIGPTEMMVVAVVVLLLFGHRLPSVMRSLGSGIVEFKKGVKGIEDDMDEASKPKLDDAGKSKP